MSPAARARRAARRQVFAAAVLLFALVLAVAIWPVLDRAGWAAHQRDLPIHLSPATTPTDTLPGGAP